MADEHETRMLHEAHEIIGNLYARALKGKNMTPDWGELGGGIWSIPDRMASWLEEHDAMLSQAASPISTYEAKHQPKDPK